MGLVGLLGDPDPVRTAQRVASMSASMSMPDATMWRDRVAGVGVAIGHTPIGAAANGGPATSACGRYVLVFDGEIHDVDELVVEVRRDGADPEGHPVLAALCRLGERALPLLNGAWSLAFVDRDAGTVLLARDHLGIVPLYLYSRDGTLWFASEIKAVLAGSGARFRVEPSVAARFLEQTLLDAQPATFFAGIDAIPAGHSVRIDLGGGAGSPRVAVPRPFWSIPERDGFAGSMPERLRAIGDLIEDSVARRVGGEATVGAMLSGGVDSSTIAAVAVARSPNVTLISGVSADTRYQDPLLDTMCAHLQRTTHRIPLATRADDALAGLAAVIARNDEPVRSFITVTEHRLKQAASDLGMRTVVGGLGADEVFAGNLVHMMFWVQSLLRDGRYGAAARAIAGALLRRTIRPRLRARVLKRYFPSMARGRSATVMGTALAGHDWRCDVGLGRGSAHERLMGDLTRFTLPSLLHQDHRSSRAFGLTSRLPFLDHRLVALVAPMAPEHKLRAGYTKWLLRASMTARVPPAVSWRKVKQGGTDAYSEWLKRDMHAPIEALLRGELASAALGLLDADAMRERYRAFCAQPPDRGLISAQEIFNPIALEMWARGFQSSLLGP